MKSKLASNKKSQGEQLGTDFNQSNISKYERRTKDIENLNRNLMKKLYADLFTRNVELYQAKNLTFENFMFNFYIDFQELIDLENPDYKLLLERMDLIVKSRFDRENRLASDKNRLEIVKELNLLSQEDDWALIDRYQKEKFLEEEKKRKEEECRKRQLYFSELDKQINNKKTYVNPVLKKKEDIYLADELKAKKELESMKIINQEKLIGLRKRLLNYRAIKIEHLDKLEKDNFDISSENKDLITYKINFLTDINRDELLNDPSIPLIVNQVVYEKDLDKIKKGISLLKYQKELTEQMDYNLRNTERPYKMTVEERKINKDLLDKAKEYFNMKYKITA